MKTVAYQKLVRDRIPEIIRKDGNECRTRTLTQEEYLACLEQKLSEELNEYLQSGQLEELADLLEVMKALTAAKGSSWDALEAIRAEKEERRGGFREKILLEEVTEKD